MEQFLNRVWATLASGMDGVQTTLQLTTGHGVRFGTIQTGNRIRIEMLDATKNVSETVYATAISGDTLTVLRAQDGTTAALHLAGDRLECRIGNSSMQAMRQAAHIQAGAETLLGTVAGTNTITAAATPTLVAQVSVGSYWKFPAAGANAAGGVTVNVDGQGAVPLLRLDGTALLANDIPAAGYMCAMIKRAVDFVLLNPAGLTQQQILQVPATVTGRQTVLAGPVDVAGFPAFLPQTVAGLNLSTQNIAANAVMTANVTTSVASPGVVNWAGHPLAIGQAISFTTTGALPTGLSAGTVYYVISAGFGVNSFEVATSPNGTAINFTGSTSGQSVCWGGEKNPLIVTAQSGFSAYGQNNLVGTASANLTWNGLTNAATNYLYVTVSNGVLTAGFTTLAPITQSESITQPSVTNGQITINTATGITYLGNGSSAVATPLVVLGTATTSGGNVTATTTYPYGYAPKANTKKRLIVQRTLTSGTSYIPGPYVRQFTAHVFGATGGVKGTTSSGGVAGAGYSEKYYPNPNKITGYTYSIGAAGTTSGTNGGTTTFDVMTVTGSTGVINSTGGTPAGVGSGGDFNATGGIGGNGDSATASNGGGGGPGTRAGNGGNGASANNASWGSGAGGGTDSNNATNNTPGIASTKTASTSSVPILVIEDIPTTESWAAGTASGGVGTNGGNGAGVADNLSPNNPVSSIGSGNAALGGRTSAAAGSNGFIVIIEEWF